MTETETFILKHLNAGYTQNEISGKLKARGIKPNSLSSIEKSLNQIRKEYGAKTNFHLAVILENLKNK